MKTSHLFIVLFGISTLLLFQMLAVLDIELVIFLLFYLFMIPHFGFVFFWLFRIKKSFDSKAVFFYAFLTTCLEVIGICSIYYLRPEFFSMKTWFGILVMILFAIPRAIICLRELAKKARGGDGKYLSGLFLSLLFPILFSWSLELRIKEK